MALQWTEQDFRSDYVDRNLMQSNLAGYSLLVLGILTFFAAIVWANWAKLDIVTHGMGTIVPVSGVRNIQNNEGGFVEQIYAKEGDQVDANQVLVKLYNPSTVEKIEQAKVRKATLELTEKRLLAHLNNQELVFTEDEIEKYNDSVEAERMAFQYSNDTLLYQEEISRQEEIIAREEKQRILNGLVNLQEQERNLIEESEIIFPLVKQKILPAVQQIELQKKLSLIQNQISVENSRLPEANAYIDEVKQKLRETQNRWRAKTTEMFTQVQAEIRATEEEILAAQDALERSKIRASMNGIIKSISVTSERDVVRPGETVVELVPLEEELRVEVKLAPGERGEIRTNAVASVKVTAYDSSIYGGLNGKVTSISPDTVKDERNPNLSYFIVEVTTDTDYLINKNTGEKMQILPGMGATVDITTGSLSVMQQILRPFKKTLREAGKEG